MVLGRREGEGGWTVSGRHHLPIALINITALASRRDPVPLCGRVLTGKEPGPLWTEGLWAGQGCSRQM